MLQLSFLSMILSGTEAHLPFTFQLRRNPVQVHSSLTKAGNRGTGSLGLAAETLSVSLGGVHRSLQTSE
ncbi:hypothetical protein WJX79_002342 [Trebouxia sp. C0005]